MPIDKPLFNWLTVLVFLQGEGRDAEKLIFDVDFDKQTVHRTALLKELLAPIPQDQIHVSKRLASIEGGTTTFDDGTAIEADVVVGADGIHVGVSKFVVGAG